MMQFRRCLPFQLSISKNIWGFADDLVHFLHADIWGAYESGILRHGFLASPSSQDGLIDVNSEVKRNNNAMY